MSIYYFQLGGLRREFHKDTVKFGFKPEAAHED
jgi:hypothetical protein